MKTIAVAIIAMVLMAFCVMPVAAANADNDLYTSKYAPVDPGYPTTGGLTGAVRCHNNLLTTGVTITDPNGIVSPLDLRADGTFDLIGLAPGKYVINIADGNGGQPEQATVTVQAGYISYLENELLGHAISGYTKVETVVVDEGAYCEQVLVTPENYVFVGRYNGDYVKIGGCYFYIAPWHGHHMGPFAKVEAVYETICHEEVSHIEVTYT